LYIANTCYFKDEIVTNVGFAKPTEKSGKLTVKFQRDAEIGNYLVHWTDYTRYAVVGGNNGKYLWILSRNRVVPTNDEKLLTLSVRNFGYNPRKLEWLYYPNKMNIERETLNNTKYRTVLETNDKMQLVVMSLEPGEDIPWEKHAGSQFIRVESGTATVKLAGEILTLIRDESLIIPPEKDHYVKNEGAQPLKLYSIYTPPEHPRNRVDERQPLTSE